MLERLCVLLKKEGISYYLLTGSTKKEDRIRMVEAFQEDDTNVFCISLKAGGTGLNLTAADIVIHFDHWWNVAVENQATDRAHRIGQKNVVTVYRIIMQNTIEERIIQLQNRKKELADQLLNTGALGAPALTKEELLELLG
jgi:SNF2 family DNA or RNA helicase